MKGKLDKQDLEKLKSEVRPLIHRLKKEKGMKIKEIAVALDMNKSKDAVNKWSQGGSFPKNKDVAIVVIKLKKLLITPDHLRTLKGPKTEEDNDSYGMPPESFWVWIPFDLELPVVDYNGIKRPISIVQLEEKKGIVTFRSTSEYDAEGEIYIDHIGMATDIEPGTKIAIRRINKMDWQPDRYYLIIDASRQPGIWELLAGDDEKTVRCVSTNPLEGIHRVLLLERIEAIFAIVDGTCIPKPKRNSVNAAVSQQ